MARKTGIVTPATSRKVSKEVDTEVPFRRTKQGEIKLDDGHYKGNRRAYYGDDGEVSAEVVHDKADEWAIRGSFVAENMRGQGHGISMYETLLDDLFAKGAKVVHSDGNVSHDADRIYASLESRGYQVTKNPSTRGDTQTNADVDYVYSIKAPLVGKKASRSVKSVQEVEEITPASTTFDFNRMKPRDRARLASMGIGEGDAKLLFKNLMDHSEFDGNKIVGMNPNKWDADAVSKYRTFLTRYTDRLVQHNDYGALSKWMSQPVASMFVQFRSFVMGAWAKSTLWTFNHGGLKDPRMMTLLLGEIAAGTATYMVRQSHLLATEEGREKWEEEMKPANLVKNGWARTATASIIPILMDSALLFTPMGPQFGNARSSGSPTDALFGSPAVDQIKSAATFSSGAMQSIWEGEEMSKNDIKAGVRALPLPMNWVPVTAAIGALIKDRE
jgi:predicted GNAT family acetyltransferase